MLVSCRIYCLILSISILLQKRIIFSWKQIVLFLKILAFIVWISASEEQRSSPILRIHFAIKVKQKIYIAQLGHQSRRFHLLRPLADPLGHTANSSGPAKFQPIQNVGDASDCIQYFIACREMKFLPLGQFFYCSISYVYDTFIPELISCCMCVQS